VHNKPGSSWRHSSTFEQSVVFVNRSLPVRRDQHGKNSSQEEAQTVNSVVHLCPRREPRTKLTGTEYQILSVCHEFSFHAKYARMNINYSGHQNQYH
jgi:hypothetical protein